MSTYSKKSSSVSRQKGNATLSLAIIFGLGLLSALYLVQANQLVAKNFELRSFQKNLKEKQEQNQKALVTLMQAKSMDNIENAAKGMNLVGVDKMDYLKVGAGSVALSQ